jgi:hypothetical protein
VDGDPNLRSVRHSCNAASKSRPQYPRKQSHPGRATLTLRANSGHGRPLFYDIVGPQEERWRNRHPDSVRGLQVHDQLEFGGLLDRQIGRLGTAQNLVNEADEMPVTEQISRPIAQQPPFLHGFGPLVYRRQACIAHLIDGQASAESCSE